MSGSQPLISMRNSGRVAAAITPRTRAIMAVHLYGLPAAAGPLRDLAAAHGVHLLGDAGQAFGATLDGQGVGALGAATAFSFYPTKNLAAYGDAGLVTTGDSALAERLRRARNHGQTQKYAHAELGWNSRLDALQAAVLSVKLRHLDAWSRARAENALRYDGLLEQAGLVGTGRVRPLARAPHSTHIFHQYTVRAERRDGLAEHLRARGIGHAVYYPVPLHLQRCFQDLGYRAGAFPRNEGLRLDFLLGSEGLRERVRSVEIDRDYRKKIEGLTPSDHAPVFADLD